jgi:hypothetical protein
MQFLTSDESRIYAHRHGVRVNDSFGRPVASDVATPLRFQIPEDAGKRVALARLLWEAAGEGASEVLIWVTESGVWPSGEHRPLVEAARRGFGAHRPLNETPGHLVRLGEDDFGLSIVCLAILFLWDCWVLPSDGRPAVYLSHDEFGVVDLRGGDRGLGRRLELFGVAYDSAPIPSIETD